MSLVSLDDVQRTIGDRRILDGISLVVGERDRIGLVGRNGCGKSTLLRILAGTELPDDGQRIIRRGATLGYLDQEPRVDPGSSIRDAVRLGLGERGAVLDELEALHEAMARHAADADELDRLLRRQVDLDDRLEALGGHDVEHLVESMIESVGLPDPERRCGELSGGERRRVALAQLLLSGPDVLLLDEPTNHLDAEVVSWLEDFLSQSAPSLVLVTHDRYFLDRVVDRIIEIDRGGLFVYQGGYAEYLQQRADRLEREAKTESSRLNVLRREAEWIRRGPPARTTKSKSRIQRYEALVGSAPDASEDELSFRIPCEHRLGEKVLTLTGITKDYGAGPVLDGLDLELMRGQRLGVVGPNGAGKTTFVRICVGELEPDAGTIERGPTVRFSYVDQRKATLRDDRTVVEEVGQGNDHVIVGGRPMRVESFLEGMLFPGERMRTLVGALSGGERSRVQLAKLLATGGNVLVLDEPTNDLDLSTLQVLEEALAVFPGAVICVSHDRWFLDRIANRVLHLSPEGHHRIWEGPLSLLLDRMAEERAVAEDAARAAAAAERARQKAAGAVAKRERTVPRLGFREREELDALPDRIAAAEQGLAALDARIADPALYAERADPTVLREAMDARQRAAAEVEALYARWEELESRAADEA